MRPLLAALGVACLTACGSGTSSQTALPESSSAPDARPAIKTAAEPPDPCAWIPAADVEAVMGKLAEPPRKADGCRYVFVMPESVLAKRQQAKAAQEQLRKAFGAPSEPPPPGSIFAAQDDPRSYAVDVKVDVTGTVDGEAALSSMATRFGFGENKAAEGTPGTPKAVNDWDDVRAIPYGFMGRTGHVRVTVSGKAADLPRDQMKILAERVRDRVPDRPFAVTNPYQVIQLGKTGDPCRLLTRAEAEAVLGPLSIDPYRSSSNWPPLAHGQGYACAYFTPGHHVFVISPTWSGGAESFKLEKGVGELVGMVLPQEEHLVIKGPWQAAQMNTSGTLLFLKDDRLLEVHYQTSRATRGDAVKLAAIAMRRLAP